MCFNELVVQRAEMLGSQQSKYGGTRLKGVMAEGTKVQPLVSVITAVHNGQQYLTGCLESVLCQDYPNIEHIVLDGGSTDGTLELLQHYDGRIALWRSEPDEGMYSAWNKGLLEARGEWICFLGVDDELLPGAIRAYMELAARNSQAEYLSSKIKVIHSTGYWKFAGSPWTWKQFSKFMCTVHPGSMHRRSLFQRLGNYDTSYRIVADYELLLRARHQLKAAYMPAVTVMMRAEGVSATRMMLREKARAKVATGGRSKVLAGLELWIDNAKYLLRPLHYALGGIVARVRDRMRGNQSSTSLDR
jgi:glycosyltransferase involved in cell wall biosynthesis